jgi:myo-inositol-1(or 4)-monophosphatase
MRIDATLLVEQAAVVAQRAGELILQMQSDGLQAVQSKSSEIDLVTEADVAAEQLIRNGLQELLPAADFWGEESNHRPSTETFWVVDPIDGTNNYANILPWYGVNIALCTGTSVRLGVTYELPAQRLYWAVDGGGAYVRQDNGPVKPLQVNSRTKLNQVLLTTGFPYHRADHPDNNLLEFNYFLARAQGVRCMGSSALDLAYVSTGALGGYWEGWLKPWDAAPGVLLVQEAGGRVTDYEGQPWNLECDTLVASNGNPALHQALLDGIHASRSTLTEKLLKG